MPSSTRSHWRSKAASTPSSCAKRTSRPKSSFRSRDGCAIVTRGRALLIVNGPLEVALAADADGVHLPEAAASIERPARPFLVGRSVHSREAAERAWAECSDYMIAGPAFETASHPDAAPGGPRLIEEISAAVAVPVIAIGGITPERLRKSCTPARAESLLSPRYLAPSPPAAAARDLRDALEGPGSRRKGTSIDRDQTQW